MLHIYCGDGKGKTTAAVGLAVRACGGGKKVLFVQFFKNGDSSEVRVLKSLPEVTYLVTETPFRRFALMSDAEKIAAEGGYHALLEKVIAQADAFDMIVLDEAISSYNYGFLDKNTLLSFCKESKAAGADALEIVLTGRDPDAALIDLAEYVSEVKKVKHPFDCGVKARKGVEF